MVDPIADEDLPNPVENPTPARVRAGSASLSRKSLNRAVSNASGIESIHTEDPHLGAMDLWDVDLECRYIAREGYYQTPVAKDGSTAVNIEGGCAFEHGNRPGIDSTRRLRAELFAERSTDEEGLTRQDEASKDPPPMANARRQNLHQRNHTLDVSMLNSYDLEACTIKERLHGYVRP